MNIPLLVKVEELSIDDPERISILLTTDQIEVPLFRLLKIDATDATFYDLNNAVVHPEDVVRKLFDCREAFWISVSGELSASGNIMPSWAEDELLQHGVELGSSDLVMIKNKAGKPRYVPWMFTVEATHIHFIELGTAIEFTEGSGT